MENKDNYTAFAWIALICAMIANFKFTIVLLIAIFISIMMMSMAVKKDMDDYAAMKMAEIQGDKIKNELSLIFLWVSMTIWLSALLFNCVSIMW